MPKLKIITAYDDRFAPVGNIAATSIRLYAAQHNHACAILPMPPGDRPHSWRKIPLMLEQLKDKTVDFVMWVDADACFVRGDANILDETEDGKDFYLVSHLVPRPGFVNIHGTVVSLERPNMGVFLVRRSDWAIDFLKTLWSMDLYINHPWWENAALLDYTGHRAELTGNINDNIAIPDRVARIKWLPQHWNSIPSPEQRWTTEVQDPFIIHFAGMSFDLRIKLMSQLTYQTSLAKGAKAIK